MRAAFRTALAVWIALLALLALAYASAFVPMGAWNGVANLAIAVAKASLVACFFMHLARGRAAYRLVGLMALFMLALLLSLSLTDHAVRSLQPAAWERPAPPS